MSAGSIAEQIRIVGQAVTAAPFAIAAGIALAKQGPWVVSLGELQGQDS